jgi:hypothetical protein
MSPEINAPKERKCGTCAHYGFKRRDRQPGDPQRCWRWACCTKKGFWFPDDEEMPGERKGCEEWV